MNERFRVEFMEEASEFLDSLDEKSKEKVLYNIWKARLIPGLLTTQNFSKS